MKKKEKMISAVCVVAFLMLGMTGCHTQGQKQSEEKQQEVEIPVIFTVDPSTGIKNEQKVVEAFNKAYDGKYYLDAEWIVETEEEYRQNLKRQNVTDTLPAVLTDLRMLPSYYQRMIADGRIEDLSPYLEADEEWNLSLIHIWNISTCIYPHIFTICFRLESGSSVCWKRKNHCGVFSGYQNERQRL